MGASDDDGVDADDAPGWAAIDAALAPLYADQAPKHYGAAVPWQLGGNDPLQGISAYRRATPVPHWHFVTYGLTELYAKESDDAAHSGYGFELTFRLRDADPGDEPPMWALNFLQNLARYVFRSGNVFEAGHYMDLNGPIALERDTAIRTIVFLRDPELAPIDTPNGRVEFLQVVGLACDELAACKRWNTADAMAVLAPSLPMLETDLDRASLMDEKSLVARLAEGTARDGSSTGLLFLERVEWTRHKPLLRAARYEATIGANQVEELVTLLPARLPFGRPLLLAGKDARVEFVPGERNAVVETADALQVVLDPAAAEALVASLRPEAGAYPIPGFDAFTLHVRRTEIRDSEGRVVRVVG